MCPPGRKGSPVVRDTSQMPTAPSVSANPAASTGRAGRRQTRSAPKAACAVATHRNPTIITGRFVWSPAAERWSTAVPTKKTAVV
jgi:hypothetical protein